MEKRYLLKLFFEWKRVENENGGGLNSSMIYSKNLLNTTVYLYPAQQLKQTNNQTENNLLNRFGISRRKQYIQKERKNNGNGKESVWSSIQCILRISEFSWVISKP
jgi:hypothetical protein